MSFKSNVGKPRVEPTVDQCRMIDVQCYREDTQCLEPVVGLYEGLIYVCGACAVRMEREGFSVTYPSSTRFVIVHPEMGIYLGSAIGLGFWSKLDPVGQLAAVTFADRSDAELHMASWSGGRPSAATVHPVPKSAAIRDARVAWHAPIAACVAAGLDAWDPEARIVEAPHG